MAVPSLASIAALTLLFAGSTDIDTTPYNESATLIQRAFREPTRALRRARRALIQVTRDLIDELTREHIIRQHREYEQGLQRTMQSWNRERTLFPDPYSYWR